MIVKRLWQQIEKGLKFIGLVQSTLILSIFYYFILGLTAIPYRLVSLVKPKVKNKHTYWQPRQVDDAGGLWRQF